MKHIEDKELYKIIMSLQIKVKKHNNKLKMNRSEGITNFNGEINKRN